MKKYLFILSCIFISLTFVACSNTTSNTGEPTNEVITDSTTLQETNENSTDSSNTDKSISKLYLNYSGITLDINTDDAGIAELLEAKETATVPETELTTEFASITAVYSDNSEELFGTIYIGDDGAYYLKFADSKVEGAAYKMGDSTLLEGLL